MKRSFNVIFVFCLASMLLGCSNMTRSLYRQDYTYLKSQSIPTLTIPPGLSKKNMDNYYEIPAGQTAHNPISLVPPDSGIEKNKMSSTKVPNSDSDAQKMQGKVNAVSTIDYLILYKPIEEAWQSVQNAIIKADYKIIKSEREVRVFYISALTKQKRVYLIHLLPQDNATRISITDPEGNRVQSTLNKKLLAKLRKVIDVPSNQSEII